MVKAERRMSQGPARIANSAEAPPPAAGSADEAVRVAKPRRAAPESAVRPTRAEINLGALRHNLRVLGRAAAFELPAGRKPCEVWGVLKADAYGHGAPAVARTLERAGMPGICVALLEEGIELRGAGIRLPILVMGGYYGPHDSGLEAVLEHRLVPVVYRREQVENLGRAAERTGATASVHVKIDTGMGRLGARAGEVDAIFEALAREPHVRLDGLMTHLACADGDDTAPTLAQLAAFDAAVGRARSLGLRPRFVHAANSAALLRPVELGEARYDLARPGIALFGVAPPGAAATSPGALGELRTVMRVRSEIVALRTIAAGERIGYGHLFEARRTTHIATVPIGYADGISRSLSNRGHVLVRGKRAPIVGAVSMDLTMIDVTDIEGARLGDEIVVLGGQEGPLGQGVIRAEEVADQIGCIPWEVLTAISRRVPRFYREP